MQPYETIPQKNFGKQCIGLEPSTVDKAFKSETYYTFISLHWL